MQGRMPVSLKAGGLCLLMLLPVSGLQAESLGEDSPSMAFLEYLGGVETEIDGRLSSPVELDIESALAANTNENSTTGDRTDASESRRTEVNSND